jgi:hypothetical protein
MITVEVNKVEQPKDIFFKGNIVESRNEIVIVGEKYSQILNKKE